MTEENGLEKVIKNIGNDARAQLDRMLEEAKKCNVTLQLTAPSTTYSIELTNRNYKELKMKLKMKHPENVADWVALKITFWSYSVRLRRINLGGIYKQTRENLSLIEKTVAEVKEAAQIYRGHLETFAGIGTIVGKGQASELLSEINSKEGMILLAYKNAATAVENEKEAIKELWQTIHPGKTFPY